MDKQQIIKLKSMYDSIAKKTEDGIEFWLARDLQPILGYTKWQNFESVLNKAIKSCETSGNDVLDHFTDISKIVKAGIASKDIGDLALTRYACYLVAQNGDSSKVEIAFAQSYFALQTRKQELIEERLELISRMEARDKLKESEKRLSKIYMSAV
jgi:DNA-damage-inducible protein D